MVVLSEGWFQFVLIMLTIALFAISLMVVQRMIKSKKTYTKTRERASMFLLYLIMLTLYFAVSTSVPSAYADDVLIHETDEHHVIQDQVRYVSIGSLYRVHAFETRAFVREIDGVSVSLQVESYQPLYEAAAEDDDLVRADGSIDMAAYIDRYIVVAFGAVQAEELTLTQLREQFHHLQIIIED